MTNPVSGQNQGDAPADAGGAPPQPAIAAAQPRGVAQRRDAAAAQQNPAPPAAAAEQPNIFAQANEATAAGLHVRAARRGPVLPALPLHAHVRAVASVRDGMIGSIYFPTYRIRTTHIDGPGASNELPGETHRFNIDERDLNDAFADALPDRRQRRRFLNIVSRRFAEGSVGGRTQTNFLDRRDTWASSQLVQNGPARPRPPAWASSSAHMPDIGDLTRDRGRGGPTMFEVYAAPMARIADFLARPPNLKDPLPQGRGLRPFHISRGTGVQITLSRQEVEALHQAVRYVQQEKQENAWLDAYAANRIFYDTLLESAPRLAERIRPPGAIRYYP